MSCSRCKKVCDEFAIKKNGKPSKTCNACMVKKRAYNDTHKAEIKAYNDTHKEEAKAYRDTHKAERKAYKDTLKQNPLCCSRCFKIGEFAIKKNGKPYKLCNTCIVQKKAYNDTHKEQAKAYRQSKSVK